MARARIILCLDLDAFYASVEELLHPEWRGLPILVGGRPAERGVVASCSYAARQFGIHSAMPMSRAVQLCPQAIRTPPRFAIYREHSQRVMKLIRDYGCPIEQVSVDEVFVDATECVSAWTDGLALATDMKQRIQSAVGLPCTIGVASNKLVAKIASNQGKPNGLLRVPAGDEAKFLAPLPISQLWGVGPKGTAQLAALGIRTIEQLQTAPQAKIEKVFGQWAIELQRKAHGIDTSLVETERETKSISRETTFVKDIGDPSTGSGQALAELKRILLEFCEEVARDLHAEGLLARTIAIKLRWANFETITRQSTLAQPTDSPTDIYQAAQALLTAAMTRAKSKVRLLGVRAANLVAGRQLSFFDTRDEKQSRLNQAVDDIRDRYGDAALRRATLVRKKDTAGGDDL